MTTTFVKSTEMRALLSSAGPRASQTSATSPAATFGKHHQPDRFETVMARQAEQTKIKPPLKENTKQGLRSEKKPAASTEEASTESLAKSGGDPAKTAEHAKPTERETPPAQHSMPNEPPGPTRPDLRRGPEPQGEATLAPSKDARENVALSATASTSGALLNQATKLASRNTPQELGQLKPHDKAGASPDRPGDMGGDGQAKIAEEVLSKGASLENGPSRGTSSERTANLTPNEPGSSTVMGAWAQPTAHGASQSDLLFNGGPTGVSAHLSEAVDTPEFNHAFASQVSILTFEGVSRAELSLNPPNMGPVQIEIRHLDHSVEIDFKAANLQTREAIQASLDQLRDLLQGQGIVLQDSSVQGMVLGAIAAPNAAQSADQATSDPNREARSGPEQQGSHSAGGQAGARQGRPQADPHTTYTSGAQPFAPDLSRIGSSSTPNVRSSSTASRLSIFA